ncbi:MAG: hypothetical protein COA99_09900 [Moraxellaceae bacterium]|nr:MAG: hypothetical protein COA99_09900 [Moraxellaceae bacterium]
MTSIIPPIEKSVSANKNATTTIVLEMPVVHHAIFPIGYDLTLAESPFLFAVPSEQHKIENHTKSLIDRTLVNCPLQPGWLMVFREGNLWKEFEVRANSDIEITQTTLHEVDLQTEQTKDHREAEGNASHYFLLPEDEECEIAYADVQWPWVLINQMGGIRSEPHPEDTEWPYLLPANQQCRVEDDVRLYQWSKNSAKKARKPRFQTVSAKSGAQADKAHQQITPIDLTRQESDCLVEALQATPFSITVDLTAALPHPVDHCTTVQVLNAGFIAHRLSNRYHKAWALLQEALTNISTPYTEEHPLYDEFPHSKYYESMRSLKLCLQCSSRIKQDICL